MIRINLSLDPSSWGSSTTVEEAKQLTSILSEIVENECGSLSIPVTVTTDLFGSNSCDEGEEDDLLWAEGMIGGPWMELALALEMFAAETVAILWGNCKTLSLKREDARDLATARGPMDDLLAFLVSQEYVRAQFETEFTADDVRSELKETGAWDAEELEDDDMNRQRLLFVLSSQIEEFAAE